MSLRRKNHQGVGRLLKQTYTLSLAFAVQLTYQAKDPVIDTDKPNNIVRQVTELRANDAFRLPGEVQPATT